MSEYLAATGINREFAARSVYSTARGEGATQCLRGCGATSPIPNFVARSDDKARPRDLRRQFLCVALDGENDRALFHPIGAGCDRGDELPPLRHSHPQHE